VRQAAAGKMMAFSRLDERLKSLMPKIKNAKNPRRQGALLEGTFLNSNQGPKCNAYFPHGFGNGLDDRLPGTSSY
jgi:hypothetical protein